MFSTGDAGQPARQQLVGRDVQLQTLRERWLQAEAGRGQLVFISGEPGDWQNQPDPTTGFSE